jgi:hypothetical protein
MLAIRASEYEEYGCPNCGCDYIIRHNVFIGNQPTGSCKHCNLNFQILADGLTESTVKFGTGRKDNNGTEILEGAVLIPHPRKGIPKWKWEAPDEKPEYGEYWNPRGIGYDLSGFIKSKAAGERILNMVKEVLNKEEPESWLDYRESEPTWIQFKFQKSEFDLDKLYKMSNDMNGIITKEILISCKV